MPSILERLQSDLTSARKAQDKARTLILGTIISDIKNRRIELQRDPTDEDVLEVVRRGIKRRRESLDMFEKGNREDLAATERSQIEVLEQYLPPQTDPAEIRAAVAAAIAGGASNVGAVMGKVMPQFKGKAEGGVINAIVREELGKQG
jgi:uncharacterized protein YqeY